MILILEKIYYFLGVLMPYSFGLGIIGFLIFLVTNSIGNLKNNEVKLKNIGILMIVQVFFLGFVVIIIQSNLTNRIRNEFTDIIKDKRTIIFQDNNSYKNLSSKEIKNELLKVKNFAPHHSHPENELKIKVSSIYGNFTIILAQDSNKKDEFWIFSSKYKFSTDNEIGRIKSELFK